MKNLIVEFNKYLNLSSTGHHSAGEAMQRLWDMAEDMDPMQENDQVRFLMYLAFTVETSTKFHTNDKHNQIIEAVKGML